MTETVFVVLLLSLATRQGEEGKAGAILPLYSLDPSPCCRYPALHPCSHDVY